MTTSKGSGRPLCTLSFRTEGATYTDNLRTLLFLIHSAPEGALILAPEVCLTNFDYGRFDAAAEFAAEAHPALCEGTAEKTLILTMIERRGPGIFNVAKVYHRGRLVYEQPKAKLFRIGGEERFFSAGDSEAIRVFEIDGIRMGILICFELRFTALWERLRGAEIIALPAQWGRARAEHYDVLGRALAIANQCYVMQSDALNDDTSGIGGIVSPFGACTRNAGRALQQQRYDANAVKTMRRYLDVGIPG